ncbi:prepilin-type N-terminal cleavage/methylation domain-containing protein [Patescibacteria group bacterium]|nr:prepilin-type N-terminal cleavage/methylation domain-containing protein [Patescibacteria group bacterium]MBU4458404.1 prepilin-type N-terminal cleavage/methylation domain-containing protein [Patescibacteria group bacterium]MCG2695841.1 prepilin-type N-terminal cleavage/methylation domain-containing protein [Candidatus Portnoybacteria bacterium]
MKKAMPAGRQGFTLIELLVSMSIFIIVIMVVLGLFSAAIKAQRKAFAMQDAQENARFLMEFMAKEVRMSVITSSNGTSPNLTLTRSDGDSVTYSISSNKIYRNSIQVSSDEVYISGTFYTEGVGSEDGLQPKLTIALKIKTTGTKVEERAEINIQTTLCQRNLDL